MTCKSLNCPAARTASAAARRSPPAGTPTDHAAGEEGAASRTIGHTCPVPRTRPCPCNRRRGSRRESPPARFTRVPPPPIPSSRYQVRPPRLRNVRPAEAVHPPQAHLHNRDHQRARARAGGGGAGRLRHRDLPSGGDPRRGGAGRPGRRQQHRVARLRRRHRGRRDAAVAGRAARVEAAALYTASGHRLAAYTRTGQPAPASLAEADGVVAGGRSSRWCGR